MIKKILLAGIICVVSVDSFAQNTPPTYNGSSTVKGFKKENIFVGGGISLGFYNNTFSVGATPEIGYSIAQWLDAGLVFNVNYASQRADAYYDNIRRRSFNYGGGAFVRIYPVKFLFLQVQPEKNWIKYNYKDYTTNQSFSATTQSSSILGGIGYTQRIVGESSFYTALMIDFLRDKDSPYRDNNNAVYPIIRAGFDIYLHPSRKK